MRTITGRDRQIAVVLAVVYALLLGLAQRDTGITRDEGYYFKAAHEYSGWFRSLVNDPVKAFSRSEIDRHWGYNHEHPVLMKTLFAASNGLFHEATNMVSERTAMRLPGIFMGALGVALLYLLGVGWQGRRVGMMAALFFAFQPRVFYHGQMACFDAAVTTMWLAVALAWLYRRGVWGHIRLGLVFGLAMSTKHNVLFFPVLLFFHWLWIHREAILRGARMGLAGESAWQLPTIPWWVFAMGIIGPIVFLLHWPYLWPDPVGRIGWYFGFHLHHEHYPVRYFGRGLWEPPFPVAFPFAMWAVTLSLPLLAAGVGGILVQLRTVLSNLWWGSEPEDARSMFLLLNAAIPVLLIASPNVPIFGGTKHWMNALPFVALMAALFVEPLLVAAARWATPLAIALLAPAVISTAVAHPHGIGAYTELAGGLRGAAELGMERQFWGGASIELLDRINREAKQGALIFCDRTNEDAFKAYQRDGLLRRDLRFTLRIGQADWWMAFNQPDSDWVLSAIRSRRDATLVAVVDAQGVPMVSLYRRSGR